MSAQICLATVSSKRKERFPCTYRLSVSQPASSPPRLSAEKNKDDYEKPHRTSKTATEHRKKEHQSAANVGPEFQSFRVEARLEVVHSELVDGVVAFFQKSLHNSSSASSQKRDERTKHAVQRASDASYNRRPVAIDSVLQHKTVSRENRAQQRTDT